MTEPYEDALRASYDAVLEELHAAVSIPGGLAGLYTRLDLPRRQDATTARTGDLALLQDGARQRITDVTAAAAAARAARQDAAAAWQRTAAQIAATMLPPLPPDVPEPQLAALNALAAAGRWAELSSELDQLENSLTAAISAFRQTGRALTALLDRHDRLRALLHSCTARAARLGAAQDPGLAMRYLRAQQLLWAKPCDLTAAAAAVTDYQQAILSMKELP
jgi:chromosome segregation ATPase